jgi:hypothetical protein
MIEGSCLCGTVRFAVEGDVADMSSCYCSMCRKAHGAAFGTYVHCAPEALRWTAGEASVCRYESSPGFTRAFCGRCGSVLPFAEAGEMHVPAALLDGAPALRLSRQIFTEGAPQWCPMHREVPRHAARESGSDRPSIRRPAPQRAAGGVLRGSCLCGAVAFEVSEPFRRVHHCHCSRCRKARASDFTTNGFVSDAGLRFLRGEEHIRTFKVPRARFFTVAFCDTCGSGVPRVDPTRGIAVVPLGALDDDPGRLADDHIYVGSAAPWGRVDDGLPQHEERPPG